MKQLSGCGRLISFASLKLIVSTSVTINSFLQAAINHLFGLPQNCCAKWDRWVGDYKFFSLKVWHAPSPKILSGRARKLKF